MCVVQVCVLLNYFKACVSLLNLGRLPSFPTSMFWFSKALSFYKHIEFVFLQTYSQLVDQLVGYKFVERQGLKKQNKKKLCSFNLFTKHRYRSNLLMVTFYIQKFYRSNLPVLFWSKTLSIRCTSTFHSTFW